MDVSYPRRSLTLALMPAIPRVSVLAAGLSDDGTATLSGAEMAALRGDITNGVGGEPDHDAAVKTTLVTPG